MQYKHKIIAVCYFFDDEMFAEVVLRGIYDFADKILVFVGANEYMWHWATPDGLPIDKTVEIIKKFPDPDKKITLTTTRYKDFNTMKQMGVEAARKVGDWYFEVCAGEIYRKKDLYAIRQAIESDKYRLLWWPFYTFYPDFQSGYIWPYGELRCFRLAPDTRLPSETYLWEGKTKLWHYPHAPFGCPGHPKHTGVMDLYCYHLDDLKPPINQLHRCIRRILHREGEELTESVIRRATDQAFTARAECRPFVGEYPEALKLKPAIRDKVIIRNDNMLSIIIPIYVSSERKRGLIRRTIDSVLRHTKNFELIIVDDNSPIKWGLPKELADTYIRNVHNKGFAGACNVGLAAARGKFICLLNDDVEVPDGWAETLKAQLDDRHPFVSPSVLSEKTGAILGANMRHPNGCCIMGHRNDWDKYKGLSEAYGRGYFEDTDLLARVEKGGRIWKNTDAVRIAHAEGSSFHELPERDELFNTARKTFIERHGFDAIPTYY